jgi:hypothetical protein
MTRAYLPSLMTCLPADDTILVAVSLASP